jgi:hypothetical protein
MKCVRAVSIFCVVSGIIACVAPAYAAEERTTEVSVGYSFLRANRGDAVPTVYTFPAGWTGSVSLPVNQRVALIAEGGGDYLGIRSDAFRFNGRFRIDGIFVGPKVEVALVGRVRLSGHLLMGPRAVILM